MPDDWRPTRVCLPFARRATFNRRCPAAPSFRAMVSKSQPFRRELPMGGCVPDLVYVRFVEPPPTDIWPDRWTFLHASILWLLRQRRYLKPATFLTLAYDSPVRVETVLEDLLDSGAIRELPSGAYTLRDEIAEMKAEVIAVEAKLRNWREAHEQASAYQAFADRVSVVIDWTAAPKDEKSIEIFRRSNVGLARVKRTSIDWIVAPLSRSYRNGPEREYVITAAAAATQQNYTLWAFR